MHCRNNNILRLQCGKLYFYSENTLKDVSQVYGYAYDDNGNITTETLTTTSKDENGATVETKEAIHYAYPNRIDRSRLFKDLCSKSKISSANLMLAQILHSGQFANTVFTTNFDDSIKRALELMGTKSFFCAENSMDNLVVTASNFMKNHL